MSMIQREHRIELRSGQQCWLYSAMLGVGALLLPLAAAAQQGPAATDEVSPAEQVASDDSPQAEAESVEESEESGLEAEGATDEEIFVGEEESDEPSAADDYDAEMDAFFAASEDDLYELDALEFGWTPERIARIGGAATVIDEERLLEIPQTDIHDVLAGVPGVYVRGEDGFGLRPNIGLRGANSDRSKKVTLMEDGILFGPAPYSAPAAYYFPLMSRITGVDVFRGPASVMYGPNTIGGAINLRTREIPDELDAGFDLAFGSYLSGRFHGWAGASNDWGGLLIEAVHLQSDGFKEVPSGDSTGYSRSEISIHGNAHTDPFAAVVHHFDLRFTYSRELSNETYLGLAAEDFDRNPQRRYAASELAEMDWWRTAARADYRIEFEGDADLTFTAYRHDLQRDWYKLNRFNGGPSLFDVLRDPTGSRRLYLDVLRGVEDTTSTDTELLIGNNGRRFVSQGVQALGHVAQSGERWSNRLEYGVHFHYDRIRRNHTEDAYLMQQGELVLAGRERETVTLNRGETYALALHVHDEFVYEDLTIAPGIRFEHIRNGLRDDLAEEADETSNIQNVVLPGIGLHYGVTDTFGVLAGVHRGFSPVAPGQPDIVDPELSTNTEFGFRYADVTSGTLVEAIGFFNAYRNLLANCGFSSCGPEQVDQLFNGGRVNVAGLELAGNHEFRFDNGMSLTLRGAYTFTHGSFLEEFSSENPQFGDVEPGDSLPYVPRHQANLQVAFDGGPAGINVSATYYDSMLESAAERGDDDAPLTEEWVNLEARAYYRLPAGFEVYVQGDNLLNAQPVISRRPFGERPPAPLIVLGGVRWQLSAAR